MHLTAAAQPFSLNQEWLQAQAFRWTEHDDGWCYGFVSGHLIKVKQSEGGIEFHSEASEESLAPRVRDYFRLDQDIALVHDALRRDDKMAPIVDKYGHIRVLRQDPWECLVAYICSANASIPRITDIVNKLAERYGDPLTLEGVTCNSIPSAEQLVVAGEDKLVALGFGLNKGKRLYAAARAVTDGRLKLDDLSSASYVAARAELMELPGVGPKIADCVCLFALGKDEAFPIDRNIGNAIEQYYDRTYTSGAPNKGLLTWVREQFGEHAGYAGQLLFLDRPKRTSRRSGG